MDEYKKLDRKASSIVTKLKNRISEKGYYENIGQKELREFEDSLNKSNLTHLEKYQLKSMLTIAIDNL